MNVQTTAEVRFLDKGSIEKGLGRGHTGSLGRFPGSAIQLEANGVDSARVT